MEVIAPAFSLDAAAYTVLVVAFLSGFVGAPLVTYTLVLAGYALHIYADAVGPRHSVVHAVLRGVCVWTIAAASLEHGPVAWTHFVSIAAAPVAAALGAAQYSVWSMPQKQDAYKNAYNVLLMAVFSVVLLSTNGDHYAGAYGFVLFVVRAGLYCAVTALHVATLAGMRENGRVDVAPTAAHTAYMLFSEPLPSVIVLIHLALVLIYYLDVTQRLAYQRE